MPAKIKRETMEINFSLISILFSFIFSIFSIFFSFYYLASLSKSRKDGTQLPKTPPGRFGLPFIGETLDFISTRRNGVPERFVFDRMKKYSSTVIKTSLLGEPFALMCGPEANKFVFSNENKLVKHWWPITIRKLINFPDNIPTGDKNTKNRRLFHPYLTPDTLQKYVPIMDLVTKQHLQSYWEGRDVVTALPLAKLLTSTLTLRLFMGVEDAEFAERLYKLFAQLMKGVLSVPVNFPGTSFNRALKAKDKIMKELEAWIKKWKSDVSEAKFSASASQSILADILKQTPDEDDLFNSLMVLFAAAFDTTSATLACVIMVLGKHSHIYNNVLAEQREIAKSKGTGEMLNWKDVQKMKYSWNVVCEVLRLYTSGPTFREAISDFTYAGYQIPKGWKLLINTCSTHDNPEYFQNPKQFDPSRFEGDGPIPYTFIPFGGGPHMCPGREYAKTKILIFMHNAVTKFRWEQIFPDERMVPDPMPVPSKGLPIRLYSHD